MSVSPDGETEPTESEEPRDCKRKAQALPTRSVAFGEG